MTRPWVAAPSARPRQRLDPADISIATVTQETPALPDLASEYTLDGDVKLRALEEHLDGVICVVSA